MKKVTTQERVAEFHRVFGHPVHDAPLIPGVNRMVLRFALIAEELRELVEAYQGETKQAYLTRVEEMLERSIKLMREAPEYEFANADIVKVADALGDLDYVVAGAGCEFGLDMSALNREIHASNMSKAGPDGLPIYDENGKVKKGFGYREPDIRKVIGLGE